MLDRFVRDLEKYAQKSPEELERFVRREFEVLSDPMKVLVMREVVRRALLHIKTARAPGSDNVTFLAFVAGDTFNEIVMRPLEAISGWLPDHTDYAHWRAERIQESADRETAPEPIRSPMIRFKVLKRLLVGGSMVAAGLGIGALAHLIRRRGAQMKSGGSAAHE